MADGNGNGIGETRGRLDGLQKTFATVVMIGMAVIGGVAGLHSGLIRDLYQKDTDRQVEAAVLQANLVGVNTRIDGIDNNGTQASAAMRQALSDFRSDIQARLGRIENTVDAIARPTRP